MHKGAGKESKCLDRIYRFESLSITVFTVNAFAKVTNTMIYCVIPILSLWGIMVNGNDV